MAVVASRRLGHLQWRDVWAGLLSIPPEATLLAMGVTVLSYGVLTLFDGLGIRYLRESLPFRQVAFSAFLSYAFNFSLGSLLGAVAMRYKLYRAWGLSYRTITKLTAFCIVTSWLGYALIAGVALSSRPVATAAIPFPQGFNPQIAGLAILFLLGVTLWFFLVRPSITLFGREVRSPSRPILLGQVGVASFQWLLQPLVIYTLLGSFEAVSFPTVLLTYLTASVLAVAAHVPAGLGVVEGTFLVAFDSDMASHDILAAMLAYRAIYFLAPLCVATVMFIAFTITHKPASPEDEWKQASTKPQATS